jgi:hypothetical protein
MALKIIITGQITMAKNMTIGPPKAMIKGIKKIIFKPISTLDIVK